MWAQLPERLHQKRSAYLSFLPGHAAEIPGLAACGYVGHSVFAKPQILRGGSGAMARVTRPGIPHHQHPGRTSPPQEPIGHGGSKPE